jgi:Pescadillo N-terminus
MLTFLEFYSTMLRFVHFRLYHSALSPFCISLMVVLHSKGPCNLVDGL